MPPTQPHAAVTTPALPSNLIHPLASVTEHLDYPRLFPSPQPPEVELGCGDASFLVQLAQRHPDHNFIGVERLLGRIRKLDRKGRRHGLSNLRGIRLEAAYFLEYLLPPGSVHTLHVYFPDPWPKVRHHHHRLVNDRFPSLAHAALVPGGCVYLRTDDPPYFEQMQAVFAAASGFSAVPTPDDLASLLTDFEREFNAKGKPTLRAAYLKSAGSAGR